MKYSQRMKEFDAMNGTNHYDQRVNSKASKMPFDYEFPINYKGWKKKALFNTPQSVHRIKFSDMQGLILRDKFNCLEVSQITICLQELSAKDFNSDTEYTEMMEFNQKIITELEKYYSGFYSEIEAEIEAEMKSAEMKTKLSTPAIVKTLGNA